MKGFDPLQMFTTNIYIYIYIYIYININIKYFEFILEIDRYIGLPILFPIFKHFTIIGYRLKKTIV